MPKAHQTSKYKWQREKFWAFMLLGLNRTLNHDFLPPWGFEFMLRVKTQAWWYYSHYGFGARYEPESQDKQEDAESLGDQPESRDKQEDGESLSDEESVGERPSPLHNYAHSNPFLGVSDHEDPERVLECESPEQGRFETQLHCPVCCLWFCAHSGSCREGKSETVGLLPKFDWESDDGGQNSGDLL
jgi:hypothetical protein